MVTLINKSGRLRTYQLTTSFFSSRKWGARRLEVRTIEHHRDGNRYARISRKSVPGALTLVAGESREGLPDQILAVPDVKAAVAAGELEVRKVADPAPARPAASSTSSSKSRASKSSTAKKES
jgi:hypothetical protein